MQLNEAFKYTDALLRYCLALPCDLFQNEEGLFYKGDNNEERTVDRTVENFNINRNSDDKNSI